MLNGQCGQRHAVVRVGLPPVQLYRSFNAVTDQLFLQPQWHDKYRRIVRLLVINPGQGSLIEMIVVIMRNHHSMNMRQRLNTQWRHDDALGSGKTQRRRPLREVRIGQNVLATGLQKKGAVPQPGNLSGNRLSKYLWIGLHHIKRHSIGLSATPAPAQ